MTAVDRNPNLVRPEIRISKSFHLEDFETGCNRTSQGLLNYKLNSK